MIPVVASVTLEDLIDTCVCQCLMHWRICMIPVFVNVTLEDLYDTCTCVCQSSVILEDLYEIWIFCSS